jgi:hypothetical protein
MNKLRTFFALSTALAISVVAACGDKVTVPADKSGKCIPGLLSKCGDTCADLQTDMANCGACGTACAVAKGEICVSGKCAQGCPVGSQKCGDKCVDTNVDRANCGKCGTVCGATELCAVGTCAGSCEAAGYLTCQGAMTKIDAGADASLPMSCVDPKTDHDNCGACGVTCGAMEACSNGTCCAAGMTGCGGACVNLQSDPNNCGVCGLKCQMAAPLCGAGACTKCNPNVLVIADNQVAINANIKTVLKNAGFNVTMLDNGSATYAGMPAATDFGAVVAFPGMNYTVDMPMAGQQALVTAQAAGVGLVLDGFSLYEVQQGRWQTVKPLMLYQTITNYYFGGVVTQDAAHPVWTNLGNFGIANQTLWFTATLINNGAQVGHFVGNSPVVTTAGVAVRSTPGGRIVNYGYAIDYQAAASQWTNDGAMQLWFTNGVRWATNCSN